MTQTRVLAALSGGVDSSVAAMLLQQQGLEVIGVTMRLSGSAQRKAIEQASAVAQKLKIEHRVVDLASKFQTDVIDNFCEEYRQGRTPNPCIVCNRLIKFGALLEFAEAIDAQYLATGHYVRREKAADGFHLFKACDAAKDQSYFLYSLNQEQLSRVLFPLGELTKTQVRQLAENAGLPNFPNESQDICFLEGGDYRSFLKDWVDFTPGDIVDEEGNIIGTHRGLGLYTIGQRHGLGITSNHPLFVITNDSYQNRIIVGDETSLFRRIVHIKDLNWIAGVWPTDTTSLTCRIRYRMPDSPITSFESDGDTGALITFVDPVRAITPGQSAVIYRCDEVVGGGIITA
jgi:tRNA-specific 2-thiouridylase